MISYLKSFLTEKWGSCKDLDYGGKPLDGVSHANEERFRRRKFIGRCKRIENWKKLLGDQNVPQDNYTKRKEILHYMSPLNIGKLERLFMRNQESVGPTM